MLKQRNRVYLVSCIGLVFVFLGANSCKETKPLEITILHTNDIHSHFRAEKPYSEKNPYNLGGLARIKSLVDQIRKSSSNTLLLDAGDFSEGTLHYFTDAGSNMLRLMDQIGYDATVVGNHDFLNGPHELASMVERATISFPVLGANKNLEDEKLSADRERISRLVPEYIVLNLPNGIRIGVIGLLNTDFLYADYFVPAKTTNAREAAAKIAKKMKDQNLADVVVLLSHNNFKTNVAWAKQVPWIHVIVSGHSHVKTPQPTVVDNAGQPVYVVEAGKWGQFLGELKLLVNPKTKQVEMKSYTLHPVSSNIAEDAHILSLIEQEELRLNQKFGRDVFHDHWCDSDQELYHSQKQETILGNLLADAYRDTLQTDVGFESGGFVGTSVSKGSLSVVDVMNIAPHVYAPTGQDFFPENGVAWTLKKLTLSGDQLKLLFNIPLVLSEIGNGGWVNVSGAKIVYTGLETTPFPVKSTLVLNKTNGIYEPVLSERTYTVALHNALILALNIIKKLKPNDERFLIDLSKLEESGVQTWESLLNWTKNKGTIRAEDYKTGYRYITLEPNVGISEGSVKVTKTTSPIGYKIEATLRNEGSQKLPSGLKLEISRSKNPNQAVLEETDAHELVAIGPLLSVPELLPDQSHTLVYQYNLSNLHHANSPDNLSNLYHTNSMGLPTSKRPSNDVLQAGIYLLNFQIKGQNLNKEANPHNNEFKLHISHQ